MELQRPKLQIQLPLFADVGIVEGSVFSDIGYDAIVADGVGHLPCVRHRSVVVVVTFNQPTIAHCLEGVWHDHGQCRPVIRLIALVVFAGVPYRCTEALAAHRHPRIVQRIPRKCPAPVPRRPDSYMRIAGEINVDLIGGAFVLFGQLHIPDISTGMRYLPLAAIAYQHHAIDAKRRFQIKLHFACALAHYLVSDGVRAAGILFRKIGYDGQIVPLYVPPGSFGRIASAQRIRPRKQFLPADQLLGGGTERHQHPDTYC